MRKYHFDYMQSFFSHTFGHTNLTRLSDFTLKVVAILLVIYINYNMLSSHFFVSDRFEKVSAIKKSIKKIKNQKKYGSLNSLHILEKDLFSLKDVHNLLASSFSAIKKSNIVATKIEKVTAKEAGLLEYDKRKLNAYNIEITFRSNFENFKKFISTVNKKNNSIYWRDVLYDASEFPTNYGAISFYVLAKN